MSNILRVTVENPDEILNAGHSGAGAVVQVQHDTTEAFSAPTDTGTIAIVTGTRSYTFYHQQGSASTWYRTRYETSAGVATSDWSEPFQAGVEGGGLLCSLQDVEQRLFGTATVSDNDRENILDIIRGVSSEMEEHVGCWLAPRPSDPASTTTLAFDVERTGRTLWLRNGNRYVGIRSISSINLATSSQPDTGGTYTTGTAANFLIRPRPTSDGPGWRIELTDRPTGSATVLYAGYNTVQITGSFGPPSVAYWAQEIAIAGVTRRFLGKETAATAIGLGPEGGIRLLADLPRDMALRLEAHRFVPAA